jgi:hypothetical protein
MEHERNCPKMIILKNDLHFWEKLKLFNYYQEVFS